MEPIITIREVEKLRVEVKEAYRHCMDENLLLTNTKGNTYYEALRIAIRKELLKEKAAQEIYVPKYETLRKFFYDDDYLEYSPNTIKVFRDFVRLSGVLSAGKGGKSNYTGFINVNREFIKAIEKGDTFKPVDFYTNLRDENCQWNGVSKWAYRRPALNQVIAEVLQSFKRTSRVSAVIIGESGTGKSTLLRQLAIECVDSNFNILWITNLAFFYDNFLTILDNSNKYLLIIENWASIHDNNPIGSNFINFVATIDNVRLVIGDHKVRNVYHRHIHGQNIFPLKANDNKDILNEVFLNADGWQEVKDIVLSNSAILDSPLFIILFILAKTKEKLSGDIISTDDVISEFKQIIVNDIARINDIYPGLSLAIYYWVSINKEYGAEITWDIFLKIADHYNGDNKISTRLVQFTKDDLIGKLLSHYLSLQFYTYFVKTGFWVKFHHDILIEGIISAIEGQIDSVFNNWHSYNHHIFNEILDLFPTDKDGNIMFFLK